MAVQEPRPQGEYLLAAGILSSSGGDRPQHSQVEIHPVAISQELGFKTASSCDQGDHRVIGVKLSKIKS